MTTFQHVDRAKAAALSIVALVALLVFSGCHQVTAYGPSHGTRGAPVTHAPTALVSPSPGDWLRFGNDVARSGLALGTAISPSNVGTLHKLWSVALPSVADSSPIYLHHIALSDGSVHNVLYVTTTDGRLLALDAATGSTLWSQHPAGSNITNASPAASIYRTYVYSYGLDGYLHEYAAATGQEVTSGGWPVQVTLMPASEKGSSAINVANGYIYVTTSGYNGDAIPYQGHMLVIRASDASTHIFNSLCSNITHLMGPTECPDERSGIWGRGGVVVDPVTKNIYLTTGNGPYTANAGGNDWGDTILEFSPDGTKLLDSYTPSNYQQLDLGDNDLGSTAPALLPVISNSKTPYLLVQGGKDSVLRLVNRRNMSGGGGPGHVGGELQTISTPGGQRCQIFAQPAVWMDPATGQVWVFVTDNCRLGGFKVVTDGSGVTQLQQVWTVGIHGTSPVVENGVLFIAEGGVLSALDPTTGATEWASTQPGAGGTIGDIHWESPIVVDGTLYCTDESGNLTAYGL